ncbi:hypothetical protein [Sporolactobacillus putidus]|uniref:Uncharacterized protein n=1 Tax=Sporolactobacillus putidus TaxID=492735 RepID=A0A917W3A1_9BACL|nr:hypothetical protein [Sporolactobacillus putidus]GGL58762.1 hypothetical protein GCM10007968_23420 [Sporolactobacillus putidus]
MHRYALFVEYDGKRTLPVDITLPKNIIEATTILNAIRSYSLRHNLELVDYDELPENDMRAFFREKNFSGDTRDLIYYIRRVTRDEKDKEQ